MTVRGDTSELQRQLDQAHAKIEHLQREVDKADNVRQFAAATEREIAGLERELRDMKAKVTQVTLERDSYEAQLRHARDDSETKARRPPPSGEGPAAVDLSRYTALVARASELEQKVARLEQDDQALRSRLQDAEGRLAAQQRATEDEPTNTATGKVPLEIIEHLGVLEESIDSLRANMRAASDETAMMDPSESVSVVASAVSNAAEHVERARDALRTINAMLARP